MPNQLSLSKVFPLNSATSTLLSASLLAVATVLGAANFANAATFNFSFSNVDGPVNGTVEGTIELPDGDGTFAATSIVITSAPAALGYTTPLDVLANLPTVLLNSFTVTGGAIDAGTSSFGAQNATDGFSLNFPGFGSLLNVQGSAITLSGVADGSDSTLTYTAVATPVSTPEPATVFGLLFIGGAGFLSKRQKQAK